MHNQDDRAHRRDERCKEARQRQEVAGRVDGRGNSKHPRHKETKAVETPAKIGRFVWRKARTSAQFRVAGVGWLSTNTTESRSPFGERVFAHFCDKNIVFMIPKADWFSLKALRKHAFQKQDRQNQAERPFGEHRSCDPPTSATLAQMTATPNTS